MEFVSTFFTPTYLFLFLNLIIGTIYITSRLSSHRPAKPAAPLGCAPSNLLDRVRSIDLSFYKFESHPEQDRVHYQLPRAPSLLQRLRSFDFHQKSLDHPEQEPEPEPEPVHMTEDVSDSTVRSREHPPLSRASSLLNQLTSINFYPQRFDRETVPEQPPPLARAPSFLECVRSMKFPSFYNPGERDSDTGSDHDNGEPPAVDGAAHGPVRRIRSESENMGKQDTKPKMRKTASERLAEEVEEEEIDAKADDFIQKFRQQLRLQRLDSIMRYKDMLSGGGGGTPR